MNIIWLKISGFRSYGLVEQQIDFSKELNFIWGGNSQGKTSLTEAFEFLLTGMISRRMLLASSKDEFEGALKNVFLPNNAKPYVEAEFSNGNTSFVVKRIIKEDYTKKADCISELRINGVIQNQDDLSKYGIKLNAPPLMAPILLQHCLSYLLSAKPQERADYFKAVFELSDVDGFQERVEKAIGSIKFEGMGFIDKIETLSRLELSKKALGKYIKVQKKEHDFGEDIKTLLKNVGNLTCNDENVVTEFSKELAQIEEQHFSIELFKRDSLESVVLDTSIPQKINDTLQAQKKVSEEFKKHSGIYQEAMKLDRSNDLPMAKDKCPLCNTDEALGTDRLKEISELLKANSDYGFYVKDLATEIGRYSQLLKNIKRKSLFPDFLKVGHKCRVEKKFRVLELKKFINDEKVLESWLKRLVKYLRSCTRLQKILKDLDEQVEAVDVTSLQLFEKGRFTDNVSALVSQIQDLLLVQNQYQESTKIIFETIKNQVSSKTNTNGWREMLELAVNIDDVKNEIANYQNFLVVSNKLNKTLDAIGKARGSLLSEKFLELGEDIKYWWNLLRPDEKSYFESVIPRSAKAKRSIDFKAALQSGNETVLRNAIAIFSQSQVNCLGLASFLAKMIDTNLGFLILDDPILSIDDDHREHFIHDVIQQFVEKDIQLILLTQDRKTWSSIQNLYLHTNPGVFQLTLDDAKNGTKIINKGDSAKAQLTSVKVLIRNNNEDIRKKAAEKLRDAFERLCKEILVSADRKTNSKATIVDYDNKTLEKLIPKVNDVLNDPAEPGKLKYAKDLLNPGNHDDEAPAKGALSTVYGDLVRLEEKYC